MILLIVLFLLLSPQEIFAVNISQENRQGKIGGSSKISTTPKKVETRFSSTLKKNSSQDSLTPKISQAQNLQENISQTKKRQETTRGKIGGDSKISTTPKKVETRFFPTTEKKLAVGGVENNFESEQEEIIDDYEGIPASEIENVVSDQIQKAKKTHIFIDDVAGSFLSMFPDEENSKEVLSIYIKHPTGEKRMTVPMEIIDIEPDDVLEKSINFYEIDNGREKLFKGKVAIKRVDGEFISINGSVKKRFSKDQHNLNVLLHEALALLGNSTITVSDKQFHLNGLLGTITYRQLKDLIEKHPDIKTLVLHQSDGSINDAVNMHTGRLIRKNKITTVVLKDSEIHSGAVDLFSSGIERIFHKGAKLGVHSWCCVDGKTAAQLPQNHPGHKAQLQYFTEMMGKTDGPAFYFYTIKAASFDNVKIMSENAIKKYNLATQMK